MGETNVEAFIKNKYSVVISVFGLVLFIVFVVILIKEQS